MSIIKIRAALEKHLATLTPELETAYENMTFKPGDEPYQEATLLPATPDNSAIGGSFYQEIGVFQIALMYPLLTGAGASAARAKLLQTHFKRGTRLVEGDTTVTIETTPVIAPGFRDRDRWRVPVSVRYRSEVYT